MPIIVGESFDSSLRVDIIHTNWLDGDERIVSGQSLYIEDSQTPV